MIGTTVDPALSTTRERVLQLLLPGERTVAELAQAVGIALPAVRRHLDILAAHGLVRHRVVHQAIGRPFHAFSLTERAREQAADGYPRLAERLLAALDTLAPDAGRRPLDAVLERMAEQIVARHQGRIGGETLPERAESVVAVLSEEGLLDAVEQRDGQLHLTNCVCPHPRAAIATPALCRSEQQAIAALVGVPVEQVGRIADGGPCCEYVVNLV